MVKALSAETNKLKCSSKPMKLKANEKIVEVLYNIGLVGKLLANRNINKNTVKVIIRELTCQTLENRLLMSLQNHYA